MIIAFNYKKSLLLNLVLFLPFALYPWHNVLPLAIGGAVIFFLFNSWLLGHKAMPSNSYAAEQILGFLLLSIIYSLAGTAAFYFYLIKSFIWLIITAAIALLFPLWQIKKPAIWQLNFIKPKFNLWPTMLSILYLLLAVIMFALVKGSATDTSLRSPWEEIPNQLFLVYFLATLTLYIIVRFSEKAWPLVLIIIHAFFTLSVAFFVFHIGFGYDPFIHRTNLNLIAENGTLLPKPFYYISQYSLLLFYNYLFKIPLAFLDKILVPLLAAVYLPLVAYFSFKDNFKTKNNLLLLTVFSIFLFPLTSFISTTPQALANLLSLLAIILSLYYLHQNQTKLWPLYLLVLAIIGIHPLAGIPMAFFMAVSVFYHHWKQKDNLPKLLKHSIVWEIIILGCLALPLAFLINSLTLSQLKVSFQIGWLAESLKNLSDFNLSFYYRKFISLPDMLYIYNFNLAWLYLGLSALGLGFVLQHKQIKKYLIFIFGIIIV